MQTTYIPKANHQQAADLILNLGLTTTVMLWGIPDIGKTSIARQLARIRHREEPKAGRRHIRQDDAQVRDYGWEVPWHAGGQVVLHGGGTNHDPALQRIAQLTQDGERLPEQPLLIRPLSSPEQ